MKKPVYKLGTSLYDIITDGVSKDFQDDQIIEEAALSGYEIDARLVRAVRMQFDADMAAYYETHNNGQA